MAEGGDGHFKRHGQDILNVRHEEQRRQGPLGDFADSIGRLLASPHFFVSLLALHIGWVICNLPFVPWTPWDPYPFTFLATVASVEAPFIALLVLMHQRHQERVDEVRDEVSLQVNLQVERKQSMTLRLIADLYEKLGYEPEEEGLDRLKEDLDPQALVDEIREELKEDEDDEEE